MIDTNSSEATSDTGEIKRNWATGIYTIDSPYTQAAMGWIGNRQIELPDVQLDIKTRNASVAVQSLDGLPINRSSSLMISLGSQSFPTNNALPFRSEPVVGQLTIHAHPGLRLIVRGAGKAEKEIPAKYHDGKYVVELDNSLKASWLFLK